MVLKVVTDAAGEVKTIKNRRRQKKPKSKLGKLVKDVAMLKKEAKLDAPELKHFSFGGVTTNQFTSVGGTWIVNQVGQGTNNAQRIGSEITAVSVDLYGWYAIDPFVVAPDARNEIIRIMLVWFPESAPSGFTASIPIEDSATPRAPVSPYQYYTNRLNPFRVIYDSGPIAVSSAEGGNLSNVTIFEHIVIPPKCRHATFTGSGGNTMGQGQLQVHTFATGATTPTNAGYNFNTVLNFFDN